MSKIDLSSGPITLLNAVSVTGAGPVVRNTDAHKTFTGGILSGNGSTCTIEVWAALYGTELFAMIHTVDLTFAGTKTFSYTTDPSGFTDVYMKVSAVSGTPVISGYMTGVE